MSQQIESPPYQLYHNGVGINGKESVMNYDNLLVREDLIKGQQSIRSNNNILPNGGGGEVMSVSNHSDEVMSTDVDTEAECGGEQEVEGGSSREDGEEDDEDEGEDQSMSEAVEGEEKEREDGYGSATDDTLSPDEESASSAGKLPAIANGSNVDGATISPTCDTEDSVASDYSVLAPSQIRVLASEDITLHTNQPPQPPRGGASSSQNGAAPVVIRQQHHETDADFLRRVKKSNFLTLAQEFAALRMGERGNNQNESNKDAANNDASDTDYDADDDVYDDDEDDGNDADEDNDDDDDDECKDGDENEDESGDSNNNENKKMISESRNIIESAASTPDSLGISLESTLPSVNWERLEQQLAQAAREQERMMVEGDTDDGKISSNDREEIRRRLAMGSDTEDSISSYADRILNRKSNLATRLQSGMNLQICFMNEPVSDCESDTGAGSSSAAAASSTSTLNDHSNDDDNDGDNDDHSTCNGAAEEEPQFMRYKIGAGCIPMDSTNASSPSSALNTCRPQRCKKCISRTRPCKECVRHGASLLPPAEGGKGKMASSGQDFFTRQAHLQAEARVALAQAKPMAQMLMEIERQKKKKKSPIADMVIGLGGVNGVRHLTRPLLSTMTPPQLQTIVNDLHSQIEGLNEDLMGLLVERDELSMEQDSVLVDIEDLTRRAYDHFERVKNQKQHQQKGGKGKCKSSNGPSTAALSMRNALRSMLGK